MRFYCLRRSRMAKTEVLERILAKRVSDGEWVSDRERGAAYLKSLRDEYRQGKTVNDILMSHPELNIQYRSDIRKHEVSIAYR